MNQVLMESERKSSNTDSLLFVAEPRPVINCLTWVYGTYSVEVLAGVAVRSELGPRSADRSELPFVRLGRTSSVFIYL